MSKVLDIFTPSQPRAPAPPPPAPAPTAPEVAVRSQESDEERVAREEAEEDARRRSAARRSRSQTVLTGEQGVTNEGGAVQRTKLGAG